MSEQRFTLRTNSVSTNYPSGRIFDNKKQHSLYLNEVVDTLNEQQATISALKEENEKLLHQNEKYEMEIRALNSKIKDWYNDSAIAKLYEKEQDKTEMLEKAYEECNVKWEKLFAENKKLKHQLAQIPPKIKEVWIE